MQSKIFKCEICGNIISMINDSGIKVVCCGEEMVELVANSVDASLEKHVPVVEIAASSVTVKIGEVDHPMTEEHYIEWILLKTEKGYQLKYLQPNEKPIANFHILDEEHLIAYAYCNLHGLWKKEIK